MAGSATLTTVWSSMIIASEPVIETRTNHRLPTTVQARR